MKKLHILCTIIIAFSLCGYKCNGGHKKILLQNIINPLPFTMELDTSDGIWFNTDAYHTYWDYDKNLTENAEGDFKEIGELLVALLPVSVFPNPEARKDVILSHKNANPDIFDEVINNYKSDISDSFPKTIHTYWNFQNLYLNIKDNTEEGNYTLTISAKNNNVLGPLPEGYDKFIVKVFNISDSENHVELGSIEIDAVEAYDEGYASGTLEIFLPIGNTALNFIWQNDEQSNDDSEQGDANLQIMNIEIN
ncbi:hypothetical protein ACFL20_07760 [Spirochaetota bacterium]